MKLSDVVSGSGLAEYAIIALLIFVAVFALVTLRILFTRRSKLAHVARLPLDDGELPAAAFPVRESGTTEHRHGE